MRYITHVGSSFALSVFFLAQSLMAGNVASVIAMPVGHFVTRARVSEGTDNAGVRHKTIGDILLGEQERWQLEVINQYFPAMSLRSHGRWYSLGMDYDEFKKLYPYSTLAASFYKACAAVYADNRFGSIDIGNDYEFYVDRVPLREFTQQRIVRLGIETESYYQSRNPLYSGGGPSALAVIITPVPVGAHELGKHVEGSRVILRPGVRWGLNADGWDDIMTVKYGITKEQAESLIMKAAQYMSIDWVPAQ